MENKLEKCCRRLNDEIKTAETCLANVSHHLVDTTETRLDTLEAHLKENITKCEAKREQAAGAGERLRHLLEQTKADIVSQYEDWKTNREIGKLEKHADKLEDRAVDAVVVAAFALLEAEVAILEALKARKTAIEVAG